MGEQFDFSGYATKNNIKCSDGRVICKDAFQHNDGEVVPLVWNHSHNDAKNVLGHALLENRTDGVYMYGKFNNSEEGKHAKELIHNGDITRMSIYANDLVQHGANVIHGAIREVSLVLAGANPGAVIDNILEHAALIHGDEFEESGIFFNEEPEFMHSDEKGDEKVEEEKMTQESEKNKKKTDSNNDGKDANEGKTIGDVLSTFTKEQRQVLDFMVDKALSEKDKGADKNDESAEVKHSIEGGNEMNYNAFEANAQNKENELIHTGLTEILKDGKRFGSLKESFLQHSAEYGIDNIDWLFPDAKNLSNTPGFIKRTPDNWVQVVMNGVHHTPFARIKMMFADLREDDARAKGYAQKGKLKKEEVFGLIKRVVEPTTVYKKQKIDRDDQIDITDFDIVSWLKGEMRMMLDEELARAFLFGDGRSASSEDKIDETHIIPIIKDDNLYTIHHTVTVPSGASEAETLVDEAVIAQDDYEGSGNLKAFIGQKQVTKMLLIKDKDGRRMYKDLHELALAMAVNEIVKVPDTIVPVTSYGVIVDLADYNVGADKGGSINMFDDFDIDYNQNKYLIETRCSGALTKPFSAIDLKKDDEAQG